MQAFRVPALAACSFDPALKDAHDIPFITRSGPTRSFLFAALTLSGALLAPTVAQAQELELVPSAASTAQVAAAASQVGGPIKRSEVMSRGMYWVNKHVPYSMYKTYRDPQGKQYRTDCSGFVSMALHLPYSPNTVSLPTFVKRINWSSLRKGDIVGTLGAGTGGANGHVVIFNGWANSSHTRFHTLEQRGGAGAVKHIRSINYKVGSKVAKPYRYKKIR
ncbi:hypothetical protein OOT46_12305 [Aquabacterium sp. A7-Y]|uniref:hypothetical protein n=1 Tax=Aquabacterium sp. A7-Y TaxID=1349605 RepID=UPI00223CEA94|nr:hypothetical protein [Aquabacterium sp. A7-Y]MCW7538625.1 hypothetical protein [Aquabacterium sp. A7-Y]